MIFQFNQVSLDTAQYRLCLSGNPVSIEPQVFDLLVYLVENRDRVVTRDELLENLWKGKVVTDAALAVTLQFARKAVDDSGRAQLVIKTIHGRGYQFIAKVSETTADLSPLNARPASTADIGLVDQSAVRYCPSDDGVGIAYAQVGSGYPLVVAASWMSHLQEDWGNPGWGHYLSHLAKDFTLIRYDQRGNGMSDWENVDLSFEKMVDDLSSVINSYDYEKVAIFGPSQAAAVSIAYARRHPGQVSHLILFGGYSRGRCRRGNPEGIAESKALVTLIRQSWGRDNPAIRQIMTSLFMPEANQQEAEWFNEFQKACGPGENIARFREMFDDIDISHLLGDVSVPTLVVHCVGDSVAPLSEGKLLASRIPGANFVTLNSRSHMLFENDPEFPRLLHSVRDFLNTG